MPPPPTPSNLLTSDPNQKLTKKQLKSLAFKAGKNDGKSVQEVMISTNQDQDVQTSTSTSTSTPSSEEIKDVETKEKKEKRKSKGKKKEEKEKGKGSRSIPDGGDLPEMDLDQDQDQEISVDAKKENKNEKSEAIQSIGGTGTGTESKNEAKRKAKAEKKEKKKQDSITTTTTTITNDASSSSSKKRKRETGDETDEKNENGKGVEVIEGEEKKKKQKGEKKVGENGNGNKVDEKKKLILFVGNMSFKVTSGQLSKHFSETCGETPIVRLLTKKVDSNDPQSKVQLSASKLKSIAKGKASDPRKKEVSKGCAFLEFKKTDSLQKALRFHHTLFEGRVINVELTAGGGGKGENRMGKIEEKNKKLDEERAKIHSKYIGPANEAQKLLPKKEPPRKKVDEFGVGEAQWGPRGAGGETSGNSKTQSGKERRNAKWSATGVNSVRLGN